MPIDNENLADLPAIYRTDTVTNFISTTKPTAKAIGDAWYKPSDGSEWYWNGAYWLSRETLVVGSDYRGNSFSFSTNLWGTALSGRDLSSGRSGLFYLNAANTCYLSSATDASNYWQITFYALYSDGTVEALATHLTMTRPGSSWFELRTNINSIKSSIGKSTILVYADISKIGTPDSIYVMSSLQIKWIHP